MFSRFVNRFKRDDLDEQRTFQKKVRSILAEVYPDRSFDLDDDPHTLKLGETILGLTNLKANFLLSSQSDDDLRELTLAQFEPIFANPEPLDDSEIEWDVAVRKLMPQLMPEQFLTKMDLMHDPLGDGVVIGFVIDSEKAYSYIRSEQAFKWGKGVEDLREIAIINLREASRGIEMTAVPGPNGIFAVNTMDGFDAVRIIDEELQDLIAEHVGSPFYAGFPNRDFLICWSKSSDEEFQSQMSSQVAKDFEERPYPLSGKPFEVSRGGIISLVDNVAEADDRSLSADLN